MLKRCNGAQWCGSIEHRSFIGCTAPQSPHANPNPCLKPYTKPQRKIEGKLSMTSPSWSKKHKIRCLTSWHGTLTAPWHQSGCTWHTASVSVPAPFTKALARISRTLYITLTECTQLFNCLCPSPDPGLQYSSLCTASYNSALPSTKGAIHENAHSLTFVHFYIGYLSIREPLNSTYLRRAKTDLTRLVSRRLENLVKATYALPHA